MRIIIAFIIIYFSCTALVFSQRYFTTLGVVSDLKAARNAHGILSGDFNGDGIDDIMTYGGRQLLFNFRDADAESWHDVSFFTDVPIARASVQRLNSDKYTDVILLADSVSQLEVLLGKPHEKFYLSWKHILNGSFDNIVVADVNNDKRADILLYGKRAPGITVYLGKGNGTFQKDTTLLSEYSYSAIAVTDVNADGINDIVATNWVSNTLLVFTGFGKMKFSEPVEIPFSSEPSVFAVDRFDADDNQDLLIGSTEEPSYKVFLGDGLGRFRPHQEIYRTHPPSKVITEDLNGDGKKDIATLCNDDQSLTLDLNNGSGMMEEHVVFSTGGVPADFCLVHHPHANFTDVAVLDQTPSKIRLFSNAKATFAHYEERTFAAGLQPDGIFVTDIDHNGWNDIAVANAGSTDISIFFNEDSGNFVGQVPVHNSSPGTHLTPIMGGDSIVILAGTDPETNSISILKIHPPNYSSTSFTLHTQGPAEILQSRIESLTAYLHLFALERDRAANRTSLIEYDQVAPARFIEKEMALKTKLTLIDALMIERNVRTLPDLIYATYDAKRHKEEFYDAHCDSNEQFQSGRLFLSLDEPEAIPVNLWSADLNHDGYSDLIINLREPENTLLFFEGSQDSLFGQPYYSIKHTVCITRKNDLQLVDMNGDGMLDVVCQNALWKAIQMYLAKRNGTFSPPVRLAANEGLGSFLLADLNGDGIPELIMTDKRQGTVKLISLEEQ